MMIGPFVFCHNKYVFNHFGKEEMGNAMFICMAAGGLAIVHGLLLGAFYLNKKIFGVPVLDLVSSSRSKQFRNNLFSFQLCQIGLTTNFILI